MRRTKGASCQGDRSGGAMDVERDRTTSGEVVKESEWYKRSLRVTAMPGVFDIEKRNNNLTTTRTRRRKARSRHVSDGVHDTVSFERL